MHDLSSSQWRRKGSSLIFHAATLGDLLRDLNPVSLRAALNWRTQPTDIKPPANQSTLLVHGLKQCLELLSLADAESLLRQRIKPFLRDVQDSWPPCGVLFILDGAQPRITISGANEELLYSRADGQIVRLSFAMWDGSSTLNVTRLLTADGATRDDNVIGYHVPRIS